MDCNSISGSRDPARKILHFSRVSHICIFSDCIEARLSVAAVPVGPGLTSLSYSHIYNVSLRVDIALARVTKNKRYIVQVTDTGNFAHFLEFVTQNIGEFLQTFPPPANMLIA